MLVPHKVSISFDPKASQIGAGRIDPLGQENKRALKIVKEVLIGVLEFVATTVLTAGIGTAANAIKAAGQAAKGFVTIASGGFEALSYTGTGIRGAVQAAGTKFAEAAATSSRFIISSAVIQTTSGATRGENAEDIAKDIAITSAVVTGISFAQAAAKTAKLLSGIKKTERILQGYQTSTVSWTVEGGKPVVKTASAVLGKGGSSSFTYANKAAANVTDDFINAIVKTESSVQSNIIEKIIGETVGKSLKGIDSLQGLALSKLKLSTIKNFIKKLSQKNSKFSKLSNTITRIEKRQKETERRIIKTFKDKIKPVTDIFNIDNVKKQFNIHFDKQTKEYNDLIQQSKKDLTEVEKLRLRQDMDNFILQSQGAMPINGQVGSKWLLGYKWIPNINQNKPIEEQLEQSLVEGKLRVFFKSRVPKRARISHKGKSYFAKPFKAAITFKEVPYQVFQEFVNASSPGEYYYENFAMHRLPGHKKTAGWQPRSSADIDFLISKQSVGEKLFGLGGMKGPLGSLLSKQLGYIPGAQVAIKYWNDTKKVIGYIKNPLGSTFNLAKKSLGKRLSIGK